MQVRLRLAPVLAALAGGQRVLEAEVPAGGSVADVLSWLRRQHPAVGWRVQDEQGVVRRHVNVFVGPDNIRDLDGPSTLVADGTEVCILPAISGG